MIINIPSPDDYEAKGIAQLCVAFDSIAEMYETLDYITEHMAEEEETETTIQEETEKFWHNIQVELSAAAIAAEQGAEFLLKARIARRDPLLLISDLTAQIRRDNADQDFSNFSTIDAIDLIPVCNAIESENRIDNQFSPLFTRMRELRNTLIHALAATPIVASEVLTNIMDVAHYLVGAGSWPQLHFEHYERRAAVNWFTAKPLYRHTLQILTLVDDALEPVAIRKFYGFEHDQMRYKCEDCNSDSQVEVMSCVLKRRRDPNCTELICIGCRKEYEVQRTTCQSEGCDATVIMNGECLLCGNYFEEDDEE